MCHGLHGSSLTILTEWLPSCRLALEAAAAKLGRKWQQALQTDAAASLLTISLGCELLQAVPGRLTVQVDARLAYNAQVRACNYVNSGTPCTSKHAAAFQSCCWESTAILLTASVLHLPDPST